MQLLCYNNDMKLYDAHGTPFELDKWVIADAIDIARDRARDEAESEVLEAEWRKELVAKVERGELTERQALRMVRTNGILAIVAIPVFWFFGLFLPTGILMTLYYAAMYPHLAMLAFGSLAWLCYLLFKKPSQNFSRECKRCRNLDPKNLKEGKFSCNICGYGNM